MEDFYQHRRQVYNIAATKGPSGTTKYIESLENISDHKRELLYAAANFKQEYQENGLVIIHRIVDEDLVTRSVEEIWREIVKLPWNKSNCKIWSKLQTDFAKDPWRPITKEESNIVKTHYPMTGQFGALTLPPAVHHHTQWVPKGRQNPTMVAIAKRLLSDGLKACDTDELMVAFDRISFKFKGHGESEFTHWDSNPFHWKDEEYEGMQGLVALCDTSFFAVPGTHTNKFRRRFVKAYKESNRPDQYYVTKDNDPFGLQDQVVEYKLKKGDWVPSGWSNRLLHEARKNTSDRIRYGYYITYFPYAL